MVPFHSKVNQIVPYRSISICKIQHSKANASVIFVGFFKGFKYQSTVFNTAGNFSHETFLLPSFDISVQSHISIHSFLDRSKKEDRLKSFIERKQRWWAHLYLNSKYQNRSLEWHEIKRIFGGRNKRNHWEKHRTNKLVISKLVSTGVCASKSYPAV